MTDAQIWTALGILAAALVGTLTTVSTLFVHVVKAESNTVKSEVRRLDEKIDSRFDALDRDLRFLLNHLFGPDSR